ncbi:MAG: Methyltransferase type 11 [Puniceicoccaceae bacterium 5H]|nr:MAG: Methyltransferase type 11 [Puniceicoccaceae bacterium 5H]
MTRNSVSHFFDRKAAAAYDEKAQKVGAINDNLHLLIRLTLSSLPEDARLLCVGVGTGGEILRLAEQHPGWRFIGVEPSESMLEVCRGRLEEAGALERCELVHGYLADLPRGEGFDAALCLLVTHFIKDRSERQQMLADMGAHLKPGGFLINADISFDTASPAFAPMLETWKAMHLASGADPAKLDQSIRTMQEHVDILPPGSIEDMLRQSGFPTPVRFFQSLLIHGWYSRKP